MVRPKLDTKGSAYQKPAQSVELLPSGCTLFDCALGGGYPFGRIVNIVGDRATAKTLLAIEACANFAYRYPEGDIYYVEAEAAFDEAYAASIGMPVHRVEFIPEVTTIEDFYESLIKLLKGRDSSRHGILVLDSLDALSDRAEAERKIDEGSFGAAKAKKLSELFRRLVQQIERHQLLVIIISQIRDNIGVTFGKTYSRSGGRALDFYASQIIYLAQIKKLTRTINKVARPIGIIIKAKLEKNKIGLPYREVQFPVRFSYGVDDIAASTMWLDTVGGLDSIPHFAAGRDVQRSLNAIEKFDDAAYNTIRKQLAKQVRVRWQEIEDSFAPKRRKYQ